MTRNNIEAIYELSPSQQGIFFETLSAAQAGVHIEQVLWTIDGALDADAYLSAWQAVVARHAALRTGFVWKNREQPLQFVLRQAELPVQQHDWRALSPADQQERLGRFLEADRRQGFNLGRAPLLRLSLLRLGDESHQCVLTIQHIVVDGWCLPIILVDVLTAYEALIAPVGEGGGVRHASVLPSARPYGEYLAWLKRQPLSRAEAFWRATLAGFAAPTPLGRAAGAALPAKGADSDGERYGSRQDRLPEHETAALRAVLRQRQITLSTLLQGAWSLLLSRYSGQQDIVFGTTVSVRPAELPGAESMVGLLINSVPVRSAVAPDVAVWPWLERLQSKQLAQRTYDYCSAGQVHGWSEVAATAPLYDSLLVFENYPNDIALRSSDLRIDARSFRSAGAQTHHALTVLIVPAADLRFLLVYDTRRFADDAVRAIGEHLVTMLRRIAAAAAMDGGPRLAALLESIPSEQIPLLRPKPVLLPSTSGAAQPRTPLERAVAAVWADVLGLEQAGVDDNFFESGGHSLLATQLVARLREAFGVELPLQRLFEAPTIAALAGQIELARGADTNGSGPPDGPEQASGPASPRLPTIVPRPEQRFEPFALTDLQQAYWLGRGGTFEMGNVATHSYTELESDSLDLERFNRAWQQLIERHDMLRAVVREDGQQQILESVPAYRIVELDLRGLDRDRQAALLESTREQMSHHVLPAEQWPLFELRASRLDERRVRLHISVDGLFVDGWSYILLFDELRRLYDNPSTQLDPPQLELSFRDYVTAQQEMEHGELYGRSLEYWRKLLPSLPPAPRLPLAANPARLSRPRFRRRTARMEAEPWQRLKQRAARAGLTPPGILLAAYAEVLATWSNSPQFTINVPLFNRLALHPQVNGLVGTFTSFTLVPVDQAAATSFEQRAQQIQQHLWQGLEHYYVNGVRILRELSQLEGSIAGARMPVVFTSLPYGVEGGTVSPIDAVQRSLGELVYSIGQTSQVWLDNQVIYEHDGTLSCYWDAVEELFPPGMLDDMVDAYTRLLYRLADGEACWRAGGLELLPPAQLEQRAAINANEAPIPDALLHTLFAAQAARRPEQAAVIASGRTLSYAELERRANRLGRRLRQLGARPDRLVAVVMEKGWEQVVAVLGILHAGAAYLPIDPAVPRERLWYLLENGEVSQVLTQPHLDAALAWPTGVERVCVDAGEQADEPEPPLAPLQRADDLAMVIYTSGSTGAPKGVMLTHRGAVNAIAQTIEHFGVGPHDRVLALTALHHDMSVFDIFGLLAAGGTIVMPVADARRDAAHWARLLVEQRVTIWNSVPAMMEMLLEQHAANPELRLATLRLAFLGGDWIGLSIPERLGALAPAARLVSVGGPTETTLWNIWHPVDAPDPSWRSIPYGRPIANTRYYILDHAGDDRPVWVAGEMYCAGVGVARGYWRDQTRTDEKFVLHERTGERLYRTGDVGRFLPDGTIEFVGRADLQLKLRGHRVEPGEVEAVLSRHPGVHDVVVALGGTPARLLAYVVPNREQLVSAYAPRQLQGGQGTPDGTALLDPIQRAEFKLEHRAIRNPQRDQPVVQLGRPAVDEALRGEYLRRQSYRRFEAAALPLASLSALLGRLAPLELDGYGLPKYRYPSGGGLYPVQLYVYVKPGRVQGLAAGVYYYHPLEHTLLLLTPLADSPTLDGSVYGPANQPIYEQAAFALFLIGKLGAIAPMYGEMARGFCLLEAGYIGQLLMSSAPEQQLGLCPVGAVEFEPISGLFELQDDHVLLHSFVGGAISPVQMERWLEGGTAFDYRTAFGDELRAWAHERLPEHMVPTTVLLLDSLPLSANGKIDRRALPQPDSPETTGEPSAAPRTPTEEALAAIWADVLGVPSAGRGHNFFELGGNSLSATQVIARVRQAFGVDVPLRRLFERPSVAALAEHIDTLHLLAQEMQAPLDAVAEDQEVGEL